MNIAIGADHRGFECKAYIKQYVVGNENPIAWIDVGAHNDEPSDYPVFAQAVVKAMHDQEAERGVLICGSGTGMAITANRFPGIFAGVVWNDESARISYEHDKVNILVIPSDFVTNDQAARMINVWLAALFKGGRYQERIDMIDALDPSKK